MREIAPLPAALDAAPACRLGLVSLASDPVAGDEIRALAGGPDRAVLEARIANDDAISAASLRAMEAHITEAAARLPGGPPYRAAAFLCTSASMLIGFAGIAERMRRALPGAEVTNPMQAALTAAEAIGARRIGLVTPYVADVTEGIAAAFEARGVRIARAASFFEPNDSRVARISAASLEAAARAVAPGAEAVFLSCTALRTARHIAAMEATLGLPVLSSNQAVAWDLLRLAGEPPAPGPWGALFARAPTAPAALSR